mmetsp:Transcript_9241/g.22263  ORF Transcript_9241/g.22263 Transcript_9241/m.22263 type:complete len:311 (+) Transcript_9241:845-1777(+)
MASRQSGGRWRASFPIPARSPERTSSRSSARSLRKSSRSFASQRPLFMGASKWSVSASAFLESTFPLSQIRCRSSAKASHQAASIFSAITGRALIAATASLTSISPPPQPLIIRLACCKRAVGGDGAAGDRANSSSCSLDSCLTHLETSPRRRMKALLRLSIAEAPEIDLASRGRTEALSMRTFQTSSLHAVRKGSRIRRSRSLSGNASASAGKPATASLRTSGSSSLSSCECACSSCPTHSAEPALPARRDAREAASIRCSSSLAVTKLLSRPAEMSSERADCGMYGKSSAATLTHVSKALTGKRPSSK